MGDDGDFDFVPRVGSLRDLAGLDGLENIVRGWMRRIRGWPVPANWCCVDWWEEILAHSQAAACRALGDYDAGRGVPLDAFLRLRVLAGALTRYRQEWAYANHCSGTSDNVEHDAPADLPPESADYDLLHHVIALLDESDRSLLDQLFWKDESEEAIGHRQGLSQQAISKRKRALVRRLRGLLE